MSTLSGHIHRAREWNGGYQGLMGGGMGNGEWSFQEHRILVLQGKESSEVDGW